MAQKGFIFVTGGVMSSLGKGLAAASLGALLQARGFRVCLRKLDLYLNVDPGTLSPYQHGEVFVMEDGTEADLDFGHYERYTGYVAKSSDYLTSGRVYEELLQKERRGDFLGATVQVIPHVTNTIKAFITSNTEGVDFVICEIGGTVGDIEGGPFLEAIRQLRSDLGSERTMFIHLTYLPYVKTAGELKTKPTQHSVKDLLHAGIQPDLLLCRCEVPLSQSIRNKLALFCNVTAENVVAALDVQDIYRVPMNYSQERFDERVCLHFGLSPSEHPLSLGWLQDWANLTENIETSQRMVTVALVGKYTELQDAYKSIKEALIHAGAANKTRVNILWCHSEKSEDIIAEIRDADAILVPGGFGQRGIDNKIRAIQFAREKGVPFFGICLGMQLAIVESFRNIAHWEDADSTEFSPKRGILSSALFQNGLEMMALKNIAVLRLIWEVHCALVHTLATCKNPLSHIKLTDRRLFMSATGIATNLTPLPLLKKRLKSVSPFRVGHPIASWQKLSSGTIILGFLLSSFIQNLNLSLLLLIHSLSLFCKLLSSTRRKIVGASRLLAVGDVCVLYESNFSHSVRPPA